MTKEIFGIQLSADRYKWLRSTLITSILAGFLALFRPGTLEICAIALLQHIILPAISVALHVEKESAISKTQWYKQGAILGFTVGAAGYISTTLVGAVDFYFLGGRAISLVGNGLPNTPITPMGVISNILIDILFALVFSGVSAVVGLLSAAFISKRFKWYKQV